MTMKYLYRLSELILGNEPVSLVFRGREEEIDGYHVIEGVCFSQTSVTITGDLAAVRTG